MSLTRSDAAIVMGMLARGDRNQDIAAWFGEDAQGIVAIEIGEAFGVIQAAPADELPPQGAVGPKARQLRAHAAEALKGLQERGADGVKEAIRELSDGLAGFDRHET